MQVPDFSIGYGTEVEESVRWQWLDCLPWVALIAVVAVYIVWRRKRKKR